MYQNGLTLKNLEEQQKINNKSIESMNLDRVSKPLIVNLNFDEKETTKLTVFGTENNEPFSVEAPIINIKTIQGAVKDIKAIFADEKSFGIGDFIESKELPEDIEMKNYNMYLRGFSENYRFVRQYFMIEGRDNSRHLYMIAYQIDKDSKIKNKILWSERELGYLNNEYLFINNSFYSPQEKQEAEFINKEYETNLFAGFLQQQLKILDKLVKTLKK